MTISECNSPVAENIQQIIRENGLKQTYIAEKAGYTTQMFSNMLVGRKIIKVCDVIRICTALGVDANSLYERVATSTNHST